MNDWIDGWIHGWMGRWLAACEEAQSGTEHIFTKFEKYEKPLEHSACYVAPTTSLTSVSPTISQDFPFFSRAKILTNGFKPRRDLHHTLMASLDRFWVARAQQNLAFVSDQKFCRLNVTQKNSKSKTNFVKFVYYFLSFCGRLLTHKQNVALGCTTIKHICTKY